MKTTLALIALLAVAAPAGAAVVELFGYTTPSFFSLESGLSLFVGAFALLLFTSAYSGARSLESPRRRASRLLPAAEAFAVGAPARPVRAASRSRRAAPAAVTL